MIRAILAGRVVYLHRADDEVEKRAMLDDDQEEEKPKRRRFCECDPDAIEISEEEE